MITALPGNGLRAPFGRYSHGIAFEGGARTVITSGQLGIEPDETIPDSVEAQAELCFKAIATILAEAGMDFSNVVRLGAFVTDRDHFAPYMTVRDRYVRDPFPASTLVIVSGFTRPQFKVEVEAMAVAHPD
jgi:2-iminobutanoate/2-iminopropanoate deaminase